MMPMSTKRIGGTPALAPATNGRTSK